MDSLMTHFTRAPIVIAFYMTSNSTGALETVQNPLKIETYEIKPWFSIFGSHGVWAIKWNYLSIIHEDINKFESEPRVSRISFWQDLFKMWQIYLFFHVWSLKQVWQVLFSPPTLYLLRLHVKNSDTFTCFLWSRSAALIVCEALILRRWIKMTREHSDRKKKYVKIFFFN